MLDKFIHTTTIHIYIIYIQAQASYDKQNYSFIQLCEVCE